MVLLKNMFYTTFHMVPRYKVKVHVSDATDEVVFVLFLTMMSIILLTSNVLYWYLLQRLKMMDFVLVSGLKGMTLLFRVEKSIELSVLQGKRYY